MKWDGGKGCCERGRVMKVRKFCYGREAFVKVGVSCYGELELSAEVIEICSAIWKVNKDTLHSKRQS